MARRGAPGELERARAKELQRAHGQDLVIVCRRPRGTSSRRTTARPQGTPSTIQSSAGPSSGLPIERDGGDRTVARARRIDHPQRLDAGAEFADRHVESARGQLLANACQTAPRPRRRRARLQQRHPPARFDRRRRQRRRRSGRKSEDGEREGRGGRAREADRRDHSPVVRRSQRARSSGVHAVREPAQIRRRDGARLVGSLLPVRAPASCAPSPRRHKLRKGLRADSDRTRRARPKRDRLGRLPAAPAGMTPPRRATFPRTDGAGRASRAGQGRSCFRKRAASASAARSSLLAPASTLAIPRR